MHVDTNSKNWILVDNFVGGNGKKGYGQSGYETLKLNVSQEWVIGINWFFAWCNKFRKAKNPFSDFLGRCGFLVHESIKSAVS